MRKGRHTQRPDGQCRQQAASFFPSLRPAPMKVSTPKTKRHTKTAALPPRAKPTLFLVQQINQLPQAPRQPPQQRWLPDPSYKIISVPAFDSVIQFTRRELRPAAPKRITYHFGRSVPRIIEKIENAIAFPTLQQSCGTHWLLFF